MPVEEQVVLIFAGTQGYLDELPVEAVRRFETEFLALMRAKHKDILDRIIETRDLDDETAQKLHGILKEFVSAFKASLQ
jgi:F-type H+-transporting ATPase subunit alpha